MHINQFHVSSALGLRMERILRILGPETFLQCLLSVLVKPYVIVLDISKCIYRHEKAWNSGYVNRTGLLFDYYEGMNESELRQQG